MARKRDERGGDRTREKGKAPRKKPRTQGFERDEAEEPPAPRSTSPAILIGVPVAVSLLVALLVVLFSNSSKEDTGQLMKRLDSLVSQVEELEAAPKKSESKLVLLRERLKQLETTSLAELAPESLSRARKKLDRLRRELAMGGGKKSRPSKPPLAKPARQKERPRKPVTPLPPPPSFSGSPEDQAWAEVGFLFEQTLRYSAEQPRESVLLTAIEDQLGNGFRARLLGHIRKTRGKPLKLVELVTYPEWVGLLGAAGYQLLASHANRFPEELRDLKSWKKWELELLPVLEHRQKRAALFESAVDKIRKAWLDKSHPAALEALEGFTDRDIWAQALLRWLEGAEVRKDWGQGILEFGQVSSIGTGTGFYVAENLVLTNEHVAGNAIKIVVVGGENATGDGETVAIHPTLDLALVKVSLEGKPVAYCEESIRVGESIFVYGYGTLGAEDMSSTALLTTGKISGVEAEKSRIIVEAKVNPGNSGGPLVDNRGNWLGVVAAKTEATGIIDSMSLAVHGQDAASWLREELKKQGFKLLEGSRSGGALETPEVVEKIKPSVVRLVVAKSN